MKLLLTALNAKYIHSNLALHYLKAFAGKYRESIGIKEYTINHSMPEILKGIYKERADIVAFSCYIWNIEMILQVAAELKKVSPDIIIWFGGPEVSYDYDRNLREYPFLDGVMIGEGEETFLELSTYYMEGGKELDQIAGIAYKQSAKREKDREKEDSTITKTLNRRLISLDEIPFPYDDFEYFQNKIIYYESSRGCPFSCSYCLSSIERQVRLRSLELVTRELQIFLERKVAQVKFVDRTFNCNKNHAMQIWNYIKMHDNGVTNFHFELSADLLGEEELEFLSTLRPGQVQLEIGVQSTNPETIKAIRRKMNFAQLRRNVEKINAGGNIHQHLDLIAGLPMENYESFGRSFQEVYALKPEQLQLGFLKILKGSLMEEEAKNYGILYQNKSPYEVLSTNWLSFDEILQIKGICEMVEVYYNSGQFHYSIQYLEHHFPTGFALYEALNHYYEQHNLYQAAHNRIKRFEILLDFFCETVLQLNSSELEADRLSLFKEILLLDYCIREDIKKRPGFANAAVEYKKLIDQFDAAGISRKNSHIEHFSFDVLLSSKTGRAVRKEQNILFDYSRRDPLNKAANMVIAEI